MSPVVGPVPSGMSPWWRDAAIYQIYPLSFADSDGDGWGDLAGITAHLDHLAGDRRSLGVNAIWLSPFYPSPMVDFGYDVADHCAVDPRFGTLADFDALLQEAHDRGLKVLVDFVPNHTSDRHSWFVQARSSRDNPKRDWYTWADPGPGGSPPNNWLSAFERIGSAWTYDDRTGQYFLHSYTPEQPDLNWRNPAVQTAMVEVMRFWLDRGVDGFRIDAPHRLMKDELLRDNPADVAPLRLDLQVDQRRHRNIDHPDVHRILRLLRSTVDQYPERVLVGEVGIRHLERVAKYYGADDDELHLAFTFAFWDCAWSAPCFAGVVEQVQSALPPWAWPGYALSNHDLPRAATRFDGGGLGPERARTAAMLLLSMRGTAFIYYGDEIGMTDVAVPKDQANDPNNRDPNRTPMQWTAGDGAGFTHGTPWLPVGALPAVNVEDQGDDPDSLLGLYQRLLRRRGTRPSLTSGDHRTYLVGDGRLFVFERRLDNERTLVALNFSSEPVATVLSPERHAATSTASCLLSTAPGRPAGAIDLSPLQLAPHEGVICDLGRG
jgi:alpha-glucosidase